MKGIRCPFYCTDSTSHFINQNFCNFELIKVSYPLQPYNTFPTQQILPVRSFLNFLFPFSCVAFSFIYFSLFWSSSDLASECSTLHLAFRDTKFPILKFLRRSHVLLLLCPFSVSKNILFCSPPSHQISAFITKTSRFLGADGNWWWDYYSEKAFDFGRKTRFSESPRLPQN